MEYKITIKNIPDIEIIQEEEKQNVKVSIIYFCTFIIVASVSVFLSGSFASSFIGIYILFALIAIAKYGNFFLIVLGRFLKKKRVEKEALIMGEREILIRETKIILKSSKLDVIYEFANIQRVSTDNEYLSIKTPEGWLKFHKYYFENDSTYHSFCHNLRETMLSFDPHLVTRIN